MRIIFSGGGTIGSVSPLLAICEAVKHHQPQAEFLWLATRQGPEKKLIQDFGITLKEIHSGKLRRYFSLKNLVDPFLVFFGLLQSLLIIIKFKPDIVLSAGGYVAVPVSLAAWVLRVPSIIHQQDVMPGLANKILAPIAKVITVTFPQSLNNFPSKKTLLTGNPVRQNILAGDRQKAIEFFQLDPNMPTVLIFGGGTGAASLNDLVVDSLQSLVNFCQIIHITGGKTEKVAHHSKYRSYDFLTKEMRLAYAASDIMVSRAGMSALTEIAALRKPAIVIPMPHSHQEVNAMEFFKKNAITVLKEPDLTSENFSAAIKQLLEDKVEQQNLMRNLEKVMPRPEEATNKILKTFL